MSSVEEEEEIYPRMFNFDALYGVSKGKKLRYKIFKTLDYKIIITIINKIICEMADEGYETKEYLRDFIPYAKDKHNGICEWVDKLKKEEK
tara:strand:+ start:236 stop:508 length:273 start_codon:yes stop_codon:yes gene_type:complete